ncbi:unnamed protein product [Phytophthora lilii]|uniref:Unnamed protein product n=1 Tax=Phytophthora lilii TaxID=2077276 RepID=A0A9W6YI19_9STRA|nr:unnamed protein product [Phytophthora lilii]
MVRDRGLQLEMIGKNDEEIDVKEFTPVDREAKHGTMSGIDEDMDQNLSNADNDAKKILADYYTQLYSNDIEIPFRLIPVVDTKNGVKPNPTYYFGQPTESRSLNIMTEDKYKKHKQVSGAAWKGLMRTIRWMDTFTLLLDWFEDLDKYLNDDDEYPSHQMMKKQLNWLKRRNWTNKDGRGLRGAGVAPLEGVVRRGRTYNFNEIHGLATPSAYTYKQLGRKYIRIPDLDAKTLVIVQPNRRKCGPKCQISDSLQAMIRTLVYKNHIDQASYGKLSIDDKSSSRRSL